MECPICHATAHIEVDTHADGFAANLTECGDCGALWISKEENGSELIHSGFALVSNS